MYCPRCGETNPDSDRFCSYCGQDLVSYRRLWSDGAAHPAPIGTPTAPLAAGLAAPVLATAPAYATETQEMPTYLGWASALLALCWPAFWAAVPALVHAARAESRLAAGDVRGAQKAAGQAKMWCWVAFGAGLVLWVVVLAVVDTV
jgi:hypothetical protein